MVAVKKAQPGSEFPLLYAKDGDGKVRQWRVWSEGDTVYTEYGRIGGKMQRTPGEKCEATNVGASNERGPVEQAKERARQLWQHKLDRKYFKTPAEAEKTELRTPMLAHSYEDHKAKVKFPIDVQPKMDGNRARVCWEDDKVVLISRSGLDYYDLPHLSEQIATFLPKGCELDGELYKHGTSPEQINSLVQDSREASKALQLWVYDAPVVGSDWKTDEAFWRVRREYLGTLFNQYRRAWKRDMDVILVPTLTANNEEELWAHHDAFVEKGYEGIMLRNPEARYQWAKRTTDLLKVKKFFDEEFTVTGYEEGTGKLAGCPIWLCAMEGKKTFRCLFKGSQAERKKQWAQRDQLVGRALTVRHFGRFKDGKIRFPRGIKFRLEADR